MNHRHVRLITVVLFQTCLCISQAAAQVADPVLAVTGVNNSAQTIAVQISDSTSGAVIRYTTNGQKPISTSTSITSGSTLSLGQNTTLEVLAFSGSTTSNLVTAQYSDLGLISSSGDHTVVINKDGTISAIGNNSSGQLGHGNTTSSNLPVQTQVPAGTPFTGAYPVRALVSTTIYGTANYTSGSSQSGVPYNSLSNPLIVTVTDAQGNPLSGIPVTFTITSGGGGIGATSFGTVSTQITILTGSNGQASVYDVLPSTSSTGVTITASIAGGSSVTFTESSTSLTGTQLSQPTQVVAVLLPSGNTQIHWVNNASTATSNVIQRSADGVTWSIIGSAAPGGTDFTDTNSSGQAYYYTVSAVNSN